MLEETAEVFQQASEDKGRKLQAVQKELHKVSPTTGLLALGPGSGWRLL